MLVEKPQNIVFGSAIFEIDGEAVGITRDGGTATVEYNYRQIKADGDRGAVKGRIVKEEATAKIEINHLELLTSFEKFHTGIKVDATQESTTGYTTVTGVYDIDDTKDYHTVAIKSKTKDGRDFIFTIKNAINLENLSLEFKDKDDVIDKVTFTSTYDPAKGEDENWELKYGKAKSGPLKA